MLLWWRVQQRMQLSGAPAGGAYLHVARKVVDGRVGMCGHDQRSAAAAAVPARCRVRAVRRGSRAARTGRAARAARATR